MSRPSAYILILTVLLNLHLQQVPNPYFSGARSGGQKSIALKEYEFDQRWEPEIGNGWKPTLSSSILVVYARLNQGEWVSPLANSQHKLDYLVGGGAETQRKIYRIDGIYK